LMTNRRQLNASHSVGNGEPYFRRKVRIRCRQYGLPPPLRRRSVGWPERDQQIMRSSSTRIQKRPRLVDQNPFQLPSRRYISVGNDLEPHFMRNDILLEWTIGADRKPDHVGPAKLHVVQQPFLELQVALQKKEPVGSAVRRTWAHAQELLHGIVGVQLVDPGGVRRCRYPRAQIEDRCGGTRRKPVNGWIDRALL